jgi:FixJ family two-component response regulator
MVERQYHSGGSAGGVGSSSGALHRAHDDNRENEPSGGPATVLLVDDDPAVLKSLSRMVRSAGYVVQTFSTGIEFLRSEPPRGPACVLLDLQMEGMNGTQVHEALRRNDRHLPVVFLSGTATIASAVAELKSGATDFLEKPVRLGALIKALSHAVDHDRTESETRASQAELRRRYDSLTPREQQVMRLVVFGMLNKQTASELGIGEKTVKVHRARVMGKMGVEALAQLVLIAERLGLTEPTEAFVADLY